MAVDNEPALTDREAEVAALIAEGKSNTEVSQALGLAYSTVNTHLASIFMKLRVNRREDVGAWHRARQTTPADAA